MAKEHGKRTRIYLNGNDLSEYFNQMDTQVQVDTAEDSGYGATDKTFKVGLKTGTKRLQGFWDDRGTADSIDYLIEQLQQKEDPAPILTTVFNPDQNGRAHSGVSDLLSNMGRTSPIAGIVGLTGDFQCSDGLHSVRNVFAKGTITGSGDSTAEFNGGTATEHGAFGHLHVFEVLGGTPVISIEESADGSTGWSTIITFSGVTEPEAEVVEVSGTIEPYLRANVADGSAVAWVGVYQPRK